MRKGYLILNSTSSIIETIGSLDDLIAALHNGKKESFNSIIRSAKLSKEDFKEHASWSKNCYTRNCIVETEDFELILLCWEPRQCTPIHDHGGEECWVSIVDGEFQETIYKEDAHGKLTALKTIKSSPGDITYMTDFMGFHNIQNVSYSRSMSLHLYAKPIRSCNIYDVTKQELVCKNLVYDTFPVDCI